MKTLIASTRFYDYKFQEQREFYLLAAHKLVIGILNTRGTDISYEISKPEAHISDYKAQWLLRLNVRIFDFNWTKIWNSHGIHYNFHQLCSISIHA